MIMINTLIIKKVISEAQKTFYCRMKSYSNSEDTPKIRVTGYIYVESGNILANL